MSRILKIAAAALFVSCFPLLLLSTNLRFEVGSERLYDYDFTHYHIAEATGWNTANSPKPPKG